MDQELALICQHHVLISAVTSDCENVDLLWIDSLGQVHLFVSSDDAGGAEYSEYDQLWNNAYSQFLVQINRNVLLSNVPTSSLL